ncbi:asparagine synthase-related protein [Micromonospora sp. WMMA1363]|uniref:asparagine synthase-related protein n=1 Tax=Micromonospora sp. WMMA1363 TaxID=3053985 RepID=UPI00259D0A5D|nr:asparagine synthase-related protein [Micromonospora sp. WMMA1363]MDM4721520.1 asparagine synthase-related protein [Micromonospora sp. WMMA1363]
MTTTLPAATGFLAAASQDTEIALRPTFAAQGSRTVVRENRGRQHLHIVLLHGAAPDGSLARRGDTAVLLAGELYNQADLHSLLPDGFGASGDADLVLALLDSYGVHAFRLLNGRFAVFAVAGNRALLATDHAGTVPLYVTARPGQVTAATEAKSLAGTSGTGGLAGTRPMYALPGVCQLKAGVVLEIDIVGGMTDVHHTWKPPLGRRILPEADATDLVRDALRRGVRARTGTDTPLVVISGGIDSSSIAALAVEAADGRTIDTLAMGTERHNEFPEAGLVANHLSTRHREIVVSTADLLARLPHTVWAAETTNVDIVEYLLPLTVLYLRADETSRRILTGYGADIPLGGMHREGRLHALETAVSHDMATFDGLNEMTPVLSAVGGHWSTHPFWDREVLDALTSLEAGLKHRHGRDKWVLRTAMADFLPHPTVIRPKLGVHEGSGTTAAFSALLVDAGVPASHLRHAKHLVLQTLFRRVVANGEHPDAVDLADVVDKVAGRQSQSVS